MSSIDIDELDDEHERKADFRRANGAPLVSDPNDPTKTLRYSRPSSYAKCLDDEEALVNWKMWKAMEGVARSPALQVQVSATAEDDKVAKKELKDKALDKGSANERADQGTGLHAMTARREDPADVDFDPPEQYVADLDSYMEALDTYGLVSEMVEVPLVNDTFRAAGTADRIWRLTKPLITPDDFRLEPGELIIGDLKTGKKLDFSLPGYCVQTALYATGTLYDIVAERRLATPPLNRQWALLAHMPVGKGRCTMHWCSVELGLSGAQLALGVKEWRKQWKNGTFDAPVAAAPVDEIAAVIAEFAATEVGSSTVEEMAAYCQRRINLIGSVPEAKKWLILEWPEGLPTPKKGLTTNEQIVTLLNLLDRVEAKYSIPFSEPDPRMKHQMGINAKDMDRSNEFMLVD